MTCGLVLSSPKLSALVLTRLHYHARMRPLVRDGYCMLDRYDRMRRQHERSLEQRGLKLKHAWQLKYGFSVADLGFHEGGFVRSGALERPRKFLQTTPFYVVERYPRC